MKRLRAQMSLFQDLQDRTFKSVEIVGSFVSILQFVKYQIELYFATKDAQHKQLIFESIKGYYMAMEVPYNFDVKPREVGGNGYAGLLDSVIKKCSQNIDNYEEIDNLIAEALSIVFAFVNSQNAQMSEKK